ncbi:Uncharacterised protein [Cedecea neteri]|uniref:Uncharacterized protein n=1 Tax=Cedecea neteri TaxID=158822 RepID=A0A2X2VA30_9ENTR|nr:Uncharacterised protein [Cedecea neteri]
MRQPAVLPRLIDLSAVQATNTEADVRACAELASRYNIISVHVLPCWTRFLSTLLARARTRRSDDWRPRWLPPVAATRPTSKCRKFAS